MYCMNCGQELPDIAKFCFKCGSKVENIITESNEIESVVSESNKIESAVRESNAYIEQDYGQNAVQAEEMPVNKSQSNSNMTLAEFRLKAPAMEGFREELLAYRKSLSNSWDYNAYVGILLGVGGTKHGDAACMNFAIGQGDNGHNTKKTLEGMGLMSVFEKYKGKKIDSSVMLSDVEDEIISVVPQYASIREKLSTYLCSNNYSENVNSNAAQNIKSNNTINTTNTVNIINTTNTKSIADKETIAKTKEHVLPQLKPFVKKEEDTLAEKYAGLPHHKTAYSFPVVFELDGRIHNVWTDRKFYNMVQEYKNDLYYAEFDTEKWTITCCRCNTHQNGKVERLAEFQSEEYYAKNSDGCNFGGVYSNTRVCRLGSGPRAFCVYKDRIYYSACQMSVNCSDTAVKDNSLWSMDLDGNDKRKELEIDRKAPALFCPYVTDKAFIFDKGYWIDRNTKEKKFIKKGSYIRFLSINENEIVAIDEDYNIFVYDFETGKRTPIEKVYKGSKEKDIIYIDAERDILYYLDKANLDYDDKCFKQTSKDIYGKIIGITKDGNIVDIWENINNYNDDCLQINGVNHLKQYEKNYSAFLFNGKSRIYKASEEQIEENVYSDSIFCATKDGNVKQIYKREWTSSDYDDVDDGRSICSVVHMLTYNYFISHIAKDGNIHIRNWAGLEKAIPINDNEECNYYSLF